MGTGSPTRARSAGRRTSSRRLPPRLLPAGPLLLALWILPSCRSTPYGLGTRLQRLHSSLAGVGSALGGEFRRAETLPGETASFLLVVPFRELEEGENFTGALVRKEFERTREGSRFLGRTLEGEMERAEDLEHPSPILWNYLGTEPARAAAAFREALRLWDRAWTDRLARDPWRKGIPGSPRGEVPSLPRPLSLGQALLLSLPIW